MKRMLLGLLLLMPMSAIYSNDSGNGSVKDKVLGTWLWSTSSIEKKTSRDTLFSFMEKEKVNTLYLQISRKINKKSYQSFIEQASLRGIAVYALDGAPSWASLEGETYRRQFFDWLQDYQRSSPPEQQFQGIQLDVEPYLDKGWKEDYQNTVKRYQDLMAASYYDAQSLGLTFTVAVPFWYDHRTYTNSYGDGHLAEWVIQNSDEIVMMAYRDQAQQIYPLVEQELGWADQYNKKVTIAVETGNSTEGEKVTFFEEGKAYMEDQLQQIKSQYAQSSSFNGLAIHSLKTWMQMKP